MKHTKKKVPLRVMRIAMIFCAAGIVCSAFFLLSAHWEDARGDAVYEQVRQEGKPSGASSLRPVEQGRPTEEKSESGSRNQGAGAVDFTSLEKINPDFSAWISAEGMPIDYPVVRGKDNRFYLEHLFTGERGSMGTIFIDYRCPGDFSGRNTILYGHNMKNGSMFASLEKYKNQSYYDRFPTMQLSAPGGAFTVELFAGTVVDGNREAVPLSFQSGEAFLSYADSLKKESTFQSDAQVKADDRIVTLCTCSYEFEDARYALFGKLTKAG